MTSYTKWDRAAYIERAGGPGEAERRRKALMARQSGHQLAEERKRHGLTQAQLAQAMGVTPGPGVPDRARRTGHHRCRRPLRPSARRTA